MGLKYTDYITPQGHKMSEKQAYYCALMLIEYEKYKAQVAQAEYMNFLHADDPTYEQIDIINMRFYRPSLSKLLGFTSYLKNITDADDRYLASLIASSDWHKVPKGKAVEDVIYYEEVPRFKPLSEAAQERYSEEEIRKLSKEAYDATFEEKKELIGSLFAQVAGSRASCTFRKKLQYQFVGTEMKDFQIDQTFVNWLYEKDDAGNFTKLWFINLRKDVFEKAADNLSDFFNYDKEKTEAENVKNVSKVVREIRQSQNEIIENTFPFDTDFHKEYSKYKKNRTPIESSASQIVGSIDTLYNLTCPQPYEELSGFGYNNSISYHYQLLVLNTPKLADKIGDNFIIGYINEWKEKEKEIAKELYRHFPNQEKVESVNLIEGYEEAALSMTIAASKIAERLTQDKKTLGNKEYKKQYYNKSMYYLKDKFIQSSATNEARKIVVLEGGTLYDPEQGLMF